MRKRIPTPEPGDDEPKYFIVNHPYPLNANWALSEDCEICGRWIAACIGSEPFFALLYKPSARGQVLLEVNRDYSHPERLLGEHRWREFLVNPTEEEARRSSTVFYSTYNAGRQAQKDGWKRIDAADSWFNIHIPVNPVFAKPYPPTSWCPPPREDATNKRMCRPLPVSLKAPPPPKAAPVTNVPGSASWATQKAFPDLSTPTALRRAWTPKQGPGKSTQTNIAGARAGEKQKDPEATAKAVPANSAAPWHTATAPKSSNTVVSTVKNTPSDLGLLPSQYLPGAVVGDDEEDGWGWDTDSISGVRGEKSWDWQAVTGNNAVPAGADAILCNVHGVICPKGICREYARISREREREKATRGGKGSSNKGRGNNQNRHSNRWKKNDTNRNGDDSCSATVTGSEGRHIPDAQKKSNEGWVTVRH